MARKYHTLCIWDARLGGWFDEFGSYKKAEVEEERTSWEVPMGWRRIISHDDSAEAMMAARDALDAPKGQTKLG